MNDGSGDPPDAQTTANPAANPTQAEAKHPGDTTDATRDAIGVHADNHAGGDDGFTITSLRPYRARPTGLTARLLAWTPAALDGGATTQRGTHGRLWYRLVGGITLGVVVLVAAFLWLQPVAAQLVGIQTPSPIAFSVGEFHCIDDAEWSPNSARIAALSEPGCNADTLDTPLAQRRAVLTLYDARTGHALAGIELDALLAGQIAVPASAAGRGQIFYDQLLWLPDGRALAVFFVAIVPPTSSSIQQQVANGVVLVPTAPLSAQGARILLDPLSLTSVPISPTSTTAPVVFERLDLTTGAVAILQTPFGEVYRWTRDDKLRPIPQPATTTAPGEVGNPLGGRQFSLWQSGFIQYESVNVCDSAQGLEQYSPQDYYRMGVTTSSISPDGRYFVPTLYAEGRLPIRPPRPSDSTQAPPATPTNATCAGSGASAPPSDTTQLPLRDAGLRAALTLVAINTQPSIQFTWRPDGQRLAVAPGDVGSGAPALTIYDCAMGNVRVRYTIAQIDALAHTSSQVGGQPFQLLRWSPDGRNLLALPLGPGAQALIFGDAALGG